jgi:hypothetical protein
VRSRRGSEKTDRWGELSGGNKLAKKEVSVVVRARIEIALAAVLGLATILTAVWPDWIEGLFGFDPDGGNGTVEWLIVAVLTVATIAVAVLARHDLRVVRRGAPIGTR